MLIDFFLTLNPESMRGCEYRDLADTVDLVVRTEP